MRALYTLDELLSIRTNGWSCPNCGKAWVDTGAGYSVPVTDGHDPECRHPELHRATVHSDPAAVAS